VGFGTLAMISVAALAGPLLAWRNAWHLPVVIGELLAGILLGATGLRELHSGDTTFTFMADIGFALVMFVAGSHVPVRDPALRKGIRTGIVRAVAVGFVAVVLAIALAAVFHTGHAALYAVLMASSSAALVLPIVDSLSLTGAPVLALLPQVAMADAACIVALPLAIDPAHALRAGLGAVAVALCAVIAFVILRHLERNGVRRGLHKVSEDRQFALELRINLIVVFSLAALAVRTHVSIMLAGFSFGLVIAGIGEPRRLTRQVFALTEGFLGPLFFLWLGASLNLRDLGRHPSYILLGVSLGAGAVIAHAAMRILGQPIAVGVLGAAQLGVPVAAAALGTQLNLLKTGEAPALILGALVCIGAATTAGAVNARRNPAATTVGK
jgi:Kef-type K+ transport system membrane component KefB